ncbi:MULTISPECIES: hypothetical protein [unclassified Lysinibacillus]|uniref:hypothetical protein n=1 Tax=unclassified Lysinibacillus TaxID=2636778 RepID=UPI001093248B|nr:MULTISPECIES: hypothetical protein [unclassified Lysinibacillus]TGN34648.1 hypothetical protein E4L99_13445 [Lysinibacillus sp. S2017]
MYFYKTPLISRHEAIINAENYLLNPPEEWGNSISFDGLDDLPEENIRVELQQKRGFWNELTNRMQWAVTIKYADGESSIVMDEHTGKFIDIIGQFS